MSRIKVGIISFMMVIIGCCITTDSLADQKIGLRGVYLGGSPCDMQKSFASTDIIKTGNDYQVEKPYFGVKVNNLGTITVIIAKFDAFNLQGTSISNFAKIIVDKVDWLDRLTYAFNAETGVAYYYEQNNELGYRIVINDDLLVLMQIPKKGSPIF